MSNPDRHKRFIPRDDINPCLCGRTPHLYPVYMTLINNKPYHRFRVSCSCGEKTPNFDGKNEAVAYWNTAVSLLNSEEKNV